MDIEKHLIVTGSSNVSWKDAIVKTIREASKTENRWWIWQTICVRFWKK